jgi:hypothetical protein
MTYTIQMSNNGWTLYRAAGITQHFKSLGAAKMLIEDAGGKLVVLDRDGYRLA